MTDALDHHIRAEPARPLLEVADVVRAHGAEFLERHGDKLTSGQRRFLRDVVRCRTAALGGHVERCSDCGQESIAYNSCRNRHCPKCQGAARARWLAREETFLLPVEYHHVVFTLPAELASLVLANPRVGYTLLFQAARDTLLELAADPRHLGAQPGILMVLHTWGQNLHFHPHVHCVVTGGGLACDVRGRVSADSGWRACRPGFFLPVRVLSRLFRGKYLAALCQAHDTDKLHFAGGSAFLAERPAFQTLVSNLYRKEWVVYAKPPFGGPEQVLKYLARYTHRVAISNARLLSLNDGRVTFRYKDYSDDHRHKTMTLSADEFLRRLLLHILPRGFVKIRHVGLLANRNRAANLAQARRVLPAAQAAGAATSGSAADTRSARTERTCPQCGSPHLQRRLLLAVSPPIVCCNSS